METQVHREPQPARAATILVVDDRPTNRQFLSTLLGYGGHRLLEAADGAEALRLVKAEHPDLVISDILMPTMDGFEFAKSVRADPEVAATKIVFYTATYRASEAALLAKACGVSVVIAKPAEPQKVLDVVNEQLDIAPVKLVPRAAPETGETAKRDKAGGRELSELGVQLTDYVNDLRGLKAQLDGLVERGLELEKEREQLRGISTKFAQNVARLHTTSGRLYALVELGMHLSQERDSRRLIEIFCGAVRRIVGAQRAVTLVLRPAEDRVQHLAIEGLEPGAARAMESIALSDGLVAQILAARKVVRLAADAGKESVDGLPEGHPPAKNFLGTAIASATGCYGIAFFTDKLGGTAEFDDEDQEIVQALAAQFAVVYEKLELHDMMERHATKLQIEVARRQQAQAALSVSERALHRAQVMAKLGHVITGPDGAFESWSETLPQLAGIEPDRMPRSTREWLGNLHPDDRESFRAKCIEAGAAGQRANVEYRLRSAGGTWIDIRQHIEPLEGSADAKGSSGLWFSTLQDITGQKSAEAKVRESEFRFRQMAETIRDVFFLQNLDSSQIYYVSPAYEQIWGRTCESLYANPASWAEAIHPDDLNYAIAKFSEGRTAGFDYEFRILRPDGELRWIHVRGFPVLDDTGKAYRTAGVAADITRRKHAEISIKRLNRVYAVLSQINALIVRVRDREELFREACRIAVEHGQFRMAWIGTVDKEAGVVKPVASAGDVGSFFKTAPLAVTETKPGGNGLAGRAVRDRKPVISNDVRNDPQRLMRKELEERGINSLVVLPLMRGGQADGVLALYAADTGFFDEEEMQLLLELAGDISFAKDHIRKVEQLNYLAYYDELTGLANRTLFHERLSQHVHAAAAGKGRVAVVMMDIERFKGINDALGRQAGDALLKQIAGRMTRYSDDPARLARIGADHFAVVVPGVQSEEEFARRAEARMHKFFDEPFRLGDSELRVSVKAGISMYPDDGADAETLFRNAEAALKKAKAGGDKQVFYTQQMTERVAEKLALENKLRQALEKEEFVLHYQPKVELETRSVVGVEALIRWQSPELGLVPPMKFIPLLEETGLILPVGAWALKKAALDHRAWTEQGFRAPRVAVNVSAVQLRQRDFIGSVEQAIMDGLAPTGIDLEITETLVMQDVEGNIAKLKAVRALGISIAIDDFGTGYSSLGYLAKLPVQYLKIDRSFIVSMQKDPNAMTLVSTMISLAHSLHLKVVAEGVETDEQATFLRLLRCDEMQGYLFSRPVPSDALVAMLRKLPSSCPVTSQ